MGLRGARSGGVGGDQTVRFGTVGGAPNFKVPEPAWPEFHERIRACYQAPAGRSLVSGATAWSPTARQNCPNAVSCLPRRLRGLRRASALPIAGRFGPRTSSSGCPWRSAGGSIIPTRSVRRRFRSSRHHDPGRRARRDMSVADLERCQLDAVKARLDAEHRARIGRPAAAPQPRVSSTQGLPHGSEIRYDPQDSAVSAREPGVSPCAKATTETSRRCRRQ